MKKPKFTEAQIIAILKEADVKEFWKCFKRLRRLAYGFTSVCTACNAACPPRRIKWKLPKCEPKPLLVQQPVNLQ